MKSLFAGMASASQGVLRVRSERVDRPGPSMLARSGGSVSALLRGSTLRMTGVDRYGTDSTLFPIVNSLANDLGQVRFHLYEPGETQQDEDRVEILPGQHPAVDLLKQPNPFQSGPELFEAAQQYVDLVGEGIVLVEFISKMPVRLWTLPPNKVAPVKGGIVGAPKGQQFLTGWIYTADNGEQVPLSVDQIIQVKMPNPSDPWRGLGPVQAALIDLDSSRYSAEWNRQFFVNGATADGVIQIEDSLSDDEFNEFNDRWRESHQGISNAHRVAMLENGAVWVPNQVTQRDMQFQELRAQSSDFIRKAFRYPKPMLGDADNANRSIFEAAEYVYGKWLIEPRARRWASALNNRLMKLYGPNPRNLVWDFDPVVESDDQVEAVTIATRATAAQTLISSGVDAQDAFAVAGLPPMKWTKPEPVLPPKGSNPYEPNADPEEAKGTGGGETKEVPKPSEPKAGAN